MANDQDEIVWQSLRDLGNEGQNMSGSEITPYGILHGQGSILGRLRWAKGKLCVFLEGSYTLATSDYLDDVGYGYFFGGDIDAFADAGGKIGISDPGREGRRAVNESINNGGDGLVRRGSSAFPDAYVNLQLGFSYVLEKKKK